MKTYVARIINENEGFDIFSEKDIISFLRKDPYDKTDNSGNIFLVSDAKNFYDAEKSLNDNKKMFYWSVDKKALYNFDDRKIVLQHRIFNGYFAKLKNGKITIYPNED